MGCNIWWKIKKAKLETIVNHNTVKERVVENRGKIGKYPTFDSSYLRFKSHIQDDGTMFQQVYKYFLKKIANSDQIPIRKSNGMSGESTKPTAASNYSLASSLNWIKTKLQVQLDGSCAHKKLVNIYIMNVINFPAYAQGADLILGMLLFGTVKLTKNLVFDIYIYI